MERLPLGGRGEPKGLVKLGRAGRRAVSFSGGAGPPCSQDLSGLDKIREYVGEVVGKVSHSLPVIAFVFLCCF